MVKKLPFDKTFKLDHVKSVGGLAGTWASEAEGGTLGWWLAGGRYHMVGRPRSYTLEWGGAGVDAVRRRGRLFWLFVPGVAVRTQVRALR